MRRFKTPLLIVSGVVLMWIVIGSLALWLGSPRPVPIAKAPPASSRPSTWQRPSDEVQAKRLRIIHEATSLGFIARIRPMAGGSPFTYVASGFYDLDYDVKRNLIAHCHAWAAELPERADGTIDISVNDSSSVVIDSRTNKTIGYWHNETGLDLK